MLTHECNDMLMKIFFLKTKKDMEWETSTSTL